MDSLNNNALSILGSTGSIGRQTIDVALRLGIRVEALAAARSTELLEQQARQLHPSLVAVTDEKAASSLRMALADTDIRVLGGEESLIEAAVCSGCRARQAPRQTERREAQSSDGI